MSKFVVSKIEFRIEQLFGDYIDYCLDNVDL